MMPRTIARIDACIDAAGVTACVTADGATYGAARDMRIRLLFT
jgi:hypothetical protein